MTAEVIIEALRSFGSPEKAHHLSRFFKTSPGDYGEGDQFLGVAVPYTRLVAKANNETSYEELQKLMDSPWHEARLCALLILVLRYKNRRTSASEHEFIYHFYMKNARRCNNWDLVDLSCRDIVGEYLVDKDRAILYAWAESDNLWEQRIAIVSTWAFIHRSDFKDTLAIAKLLFSSKQDLIHKAVGWMLREVEKQDRATLTAFIEANIHRMPRTTLRYAIEHYPENERLEFLHRK